MRISCYMNKMFVVLFFIFVMTRETTTSDSKPMDGLSCRHVTQSQQLCTGKNEDYAIGFHNSQHIGSVKFRRKKKPAHKDCNSTCVVKNETLLPTLAHDSYGRLRFIFQDEENNMTQMVKLVTCRADDENNMTSIVVFTKYEFVSWDPFYNYFDPDIVTFNLPTCCKCGSKSDVLE